MTGKLVRLMVTIVCAAAAVDMLSGSPATWSRAIAGGLLISLAILTAVAEWQVAHRAVAAAPERAPVTCDRCGASISDIARGLECTSVAHFVSASDRLREMHR